MSDAQPDLNELINTLRGLTAEAARTTQVGHRRQPYFQERYANWAKDLIDKVISSGKPHVIPVGDLASSTVKLQWTQATSYLFKYLDKDGKYADLYKKLSVTHDKTRGTFISPKKVTGILKAYQTEDWKIRFHEWIDTVQPGEGNELAIFERIGIGLTEEDAKYINDFLTPLEDLFVWDINIIHDTLKVIRIDKSRAEELLETENI